MTRPIFNDGDVLDAATVNQLARPHVTSEDELAAVSLVTNDDLDPTPGYIKSDFYGWYQRLELSVSTGLTLQYSAYKAALPDGTLVNGSAGTLVLVDDQNLFVYLNSSGAVAASTQIPATCALLASAVTASGEITSLVDLREQQVEQVTPYYLPATASPFLTGEIRAVSFSGAPAGWLLCDGASYSTADYPQLFAAIGYSFGGSGTSFKVPDLRGRTPIGAGSGGVDENGYALDTRTLGQIGGAQRRQISVSQLPAHTHQVRDFGHTHGTDEGVGHLHSATTDPHSHSLNQAPHSHSLGYWRATIDPPTTVPGAELSVATKISPKDVPSTAATTIDISVNSAQPAVNVKHAKTNLAVLSSNSNITVLNQGGNQHFDVQSPYLVVNYIIRSA
jgi:microcystin-dependent protein